MEQQFTENAFRCAYFQPKEGERIIMHIKDARRHEEGMTCMHCDGPVVACKGMKNIHHFRHRANTSDCIKMRNGNEGMTAEHINAQTKMLRLWDDENCHKLLIEQHFCDCSGNVINLMDFRRDGNIMVAEYKQKHNDRRISWDLAILSLHGSFIFGIEIEKTNRTRETSRPDTENWCELLATDVNHHTANDTLQCKRVRPFTCEFCLCMLRRKQEQLERARRFATCNRLKLEQIELNQKRENARKNNCECIHLCCCHRCTKHDVIGFIKCNGCKFI